MSVGVRILKERDWYDWHTMLERPLLGQELDHSAVQLTVEAHKTEPCHAAAVQRDGKVIFVCADPSRHGEVDPGSASRAAQTQQHTQQQRRENRLRRDAAQGRRQTMERALAAASPTDLTFAARQITGNWRLDDSKLACNLLGVEPIVEQGGYGSHKNYQAALSAYAAGSQAAAIRAVLALAFACGEGTVCSTWGGVTALSRRHVEQLAARGYEANESDRKHLSSEPTPVEPADEGNEERECRLCGDVDEDLRADGRHWVDDPEGIGDLCTACRERIASAAPAVSAAGG
jgi:hypothetical protein